MNTEIKLLTDEWIETEARKRKQIPIAVFTIVAVHVVLFLGLLGSSGCKPKADAVSETTAENMRDREFEAAATRSNQAQWAAAEASAAVAQEPVMAEPIVAEPAVFRREAGGMVAKPVTLANASLERSTRIYVVKPGDNLGKIARANGTTPKTLKKVNGLKSDVIRVGQKLRVS